MAPRKLTQIERWIGTEAERLALDASGFSPGSTFFERDTGSMHKWDGTSWGKEIITVADIADIKTAIESLDNKELATEPTLAQILTILGETAADIGTLKLENGQIKGYDGTDWQPVRVNDAGELILASEVTVNAEGLSVDLGKLVLQAKNPSGVPVDMKSDTEGNLKVSLSGYIMALGRLRVVRESATLSQGESIDILPPTSDPLELSIFEFSANQKNVAVDVLIRNKDGIGVSYDTTPNDAVSFNYANTFEFVKGHFSPIFKVVVYVENENRFKMVLKDKLLLPNGGLIRIRNTSTETVDVRCQGVIRELT